MTANSHDSTTAPGKGETSSAIERAADILSLFGRKGPELGITEISQELGLSKAVVYRVLNTFRQKGFIEMDEESHRYSLGPEILVLGLSLLERVDVRILAREAMQRLSDATNETATLSLRSGMGRVYVDQVTPQRDIKMVVQIGAVYPLHTGSSSRAILAYLSKQEQDEYLAGDLVSLTDNTNTDPKSIREHLDIVRERGYSTSKGERQEGAAAVAAPILGFDGKPVGTISVCGPIERFEPHMEQAAQLLVAEARAISEKLGYRGER